jgi:outer membrane protein assembly factor BamB
VIHAGRVIVLCDVLEEPFLAAFDVRTGEPIWRTPRYDVPTWCTPTIYVGSERTQIVVNGYDHLGGYDFETGAPIWSMVGGGAVPIPTAVAAHGLFFVTSAGGMPGGRGEAAVRAPIFAIRADAQGEVTEDNYMAWCTRRGGNYIPSPLVYGDELYCATISILTCYDARTGEERYRYRIGDPTATFAASPVAGDGKVYLTKDDGTVHVLRAGPEYEVLAENDLGETCMATPAISEGVLYFRTRGQLVAVASDG